MKLVPAATRCNVSASFSNSSMVVVCAVLCTYFPISYILILLSHDMKKSFLTEVGCHLRFLEFEITSNNVMFMLTEPFMQERHSCKY